MNNIGHEMLPIPPTATPNTPLRTSLAFAVGFVAGLIVFGVLGVVL